MRGQYTDLKRLSITCPSAGSIFANVFLTGRIGHSLVPAIHSRTSLSAILFVVTVVSPLLSYMSSMPDQLPAILALVSASGRLGLEAFLPSSESRRPGAPSSDDRTPYLPLVDRWEDGDFSLKAVMSASKETSVRLWTLLLLERYRFVLGKLRVLYPHLFRSQVSHIADTPSHFAMLSGPSTVNIMAAQLARRPDVALLCINDDVITGHEEVVTMLKKWQSEQWSQPAEWET